MRNILLGAFLLLSVLLRPAAAADDPPSYPPGIVRLGIGIGIPYGGVGINLDLFPVQYLAISGAAGTAIFDDLLMVGGKLFPLGREDRFNPRFAGYYVNDTSHKLFGGTTTRTGFAISGGFEWRFTRHQGLDVDLSYLDVSQGDTVVLPAIGYFVTF